MLKLETLYVCVLGFVEDPPFIRKAYKWKGKITREERKPYLAFFCHKMDMGMKVDQNVF